MNFTENEKSAATKVLTDIILADGIVDENELKLGQAISSVMGANETNYEMAKNLSIEKSICILKEMSMVKRLTFGKLMYAMAAIDGEVDREEAGIVVIVLIAMGLTSEDVL